MFKRANESYQNSQIEPKSHNSHQQLRYLNVELVLAQIGRKITKNSVHLCAKFAGKNIPQMFLPHERRKLFMSWNCEKLALESGRNARNEHKLCFNPIRLHFTRWIIQKRWPNFFTLTRNTHERQIVVCSICDGCFYGNDRLFVGEFVWFVFMNTVLVFIRVFRLRLEDVSRYTYNIHS